MLYIAGDILWAAARMAGTSVKCCGRWDAAALFFLGHDIWFGLGLFSYGMIHMAYILIWYDTYDNNVFRRHSGSSFWLALIVAGRICCSRVRLSFIGVGALVVARCASALLGWAHLS